MFDDEAIEERLVPVMQAHQVDVAFQVVLLPPVVLHRARDLFLDGEHLGRQEPFEPERQPFGLRERGSLVEQGILQQSRPCWNAGLRFGELGCIGHWFLQQPSHRVINRHMR